MTPYRCFVPRPMTDRVFWERIRTDPVLSAP